MKMTRFAKFVDKTENVINKFKCWQVSKWLKAVIILGISVLLFGVFYYLTAFTILLALIMAFKFFPEDVKGILNFFSEIFSTDDAKKDTEDGYRDGDLGFGFYVGDIRTDDD
ncbi:DUF3742 family protein [Avibacterium paragallinarum]|uniref:DUF3742 family protein n=1 Tax=Avibacterium TaxID=292486 RepID=UPI002025CE01|nr:MULTISPECIES: DUF3742 family protein [unclassified Avibacterium]MCW9733996.1 DUF3742 family protein [Avibacterium sp. 20-15]URL03644.1 DUF3742 family protein [Avibacterium sp. 20-132]